ncbi:MAG: MOSC domain-containing protein [Nitrososphaerales archaeon]
MEEKIGALKILRRYPVKGMRGEDLESIFLTRSGIIGDRNYAFIDENAKNKAFPWMTARLRREMVLFKPEITSANKVQVTTPEGQTFFLDDPAFEEMLEKRFGYSLLLRHDTSGCYDSKPVSIFGLATLNALVSELGNLQYERFRANIYPEWTCGEPYFEDSLVGKSLKIGERAKIKVVKKNSRCVVPTIDPYSAAASPQVQKYIEESRGGCVGVYALVEREGEINLNDDISIVESDSTLL